MKYTRQWGRKNFAPIIMEQYTTKAKETQFLHCKIPAAVAIMKRKKQKPAIIINIRSRKNRYCAEIRALISRFEKYMQAKMRKASRKKGDNCRENI